MRSARALIALAVVAAALVVGLAHQAAGNAGDPLILGATNITGPDDITSLSGRFVVESPPHSLADVFTVAGRTHFIGPVTFSCTSGLIVIPAGQTEGSVTDPCFAAEGLSVVATIQNAQRGRYVAGVSGSGDTMTIFLNKPAKVDTTVAFLWTG